MSTKDIFKEIYQKKIWNPEPEKNIYKFYSGIGSHYDEFTNIYINKIKELLLSFPEKPNVVDLGCGDFKIGSQIRKFCNRYVAVDIFEDIIDFNKSHYKDLDVDFRVLDITKEQLPEGDICLVRQVLQHLSNDLIKKFIKLINNKYKYLIITEHLPSDKNFKPNIDMPTGPFIRINKKSGIVLTKEPFNLKVVKELDVCNIYPKSIKNFEGVVNTKLLELN